MADYLVSFRGTIHAPTINEIFSHSMAVTSSSSQETVAEDIRVEWDRTFNDATVPINLHFNENILWTEVVAAGIINKTTGDLMAGSHAVWPTPLKGTSLANSLPAQDALAVSLWGGLRPNGTIVKGRFYLPPLVTTACIGNGLLNSTVQQRFVDNMTLFISRVIGKGHNPCVWSRTVGALQTVSWVKVGNQIDTIRSRRNAGVEVYMQSDVAP